MSSDLVATHEYGHLSMAQFFCGPNRLVRFNYYSWRLHGHQDPYWKSSRTFLVQGRNLLGVHNSDVILVRRKKKLQIFEASPIEACVGGRYFAIFFEVYSVSRGFEKVAVLSESLSALFAYTRTLNDLGYYSISLSNCAAEMIGLLDTGKHFDFLIYDAFELTTHSCALKAITRYSAITSIIMVADVNSKQRQDLTLWARVQGIPMLGVLQSPLRSRELKCLMAREPVW